MGLVKYIYGTDAQILNLTDTHVLWVEQAFYYPTDAAFFYQLRSGVMVRFGGDATTPQVGEGGIGIKLNNYVIGGVKSVIEINEVLYIPINWDYNTFSLDIEGIIINDGQINIL